MTTATRPAAATDECLEYLDTLRDSGATNMFGAGPFLEAKFGFSRREAREALLYWMKTYSERHKGAS